MKNGDIFCCGLGSFETVAGYRVLPEVRGSYLGFRAWVDKASRYFGIVELAAQFPGKDEAITGGPPRVILWATAHLN